MTSMPSGQEPGPFTSNADYPYVGDGGTFWLNPSTFMDEKGMPCFMCGRPTIWVDIDYGAHYCGTVRCERRIKRGLRRSNFRLWLREVFRAG